MSSCGSVIVTDEAGNISESGICFGDMVCFLDWLEETADEHIKDGNTNFLSAWINPALLNTEVAEAVFKILAGKKEKPPVGSAYEKLRYAQLKGCGSVRVTEISTGKTGTARIITSGIDIHFDGDPEGAGEVVSIDYFNRRFFVSAIIMNTESEEAPQ